MAKRNGSKRRSGQAKYGRQKKKASRYGSPISLFVRGKINGEQYFKMTGQAIKRKVPHGAF